MIALSWNRYRMYLYADVAFTQNTLFNACYPLFLQPAHWPHCMVESNVIFSVSLPHLDCVLKYVHIGLMTANHFWGAKVFRFRYSYGFMFVYIFLSFCKWRHSRHSLQSLKSSPLAFRRISIEPNVFKKMC